MAAVPFFASHLTEVSAMAIATVDPPISELATVEDSPDPIAKLTKRRILIDAVILSFGFLLSFAAFHATVNLQTSLRPVNGTGNRILIVLNLAAFISNLLLTMPINGRLGLKGSMMLCLFTHASLPASNMYPNDAMLYSGAVITGLGAGPLWSAKSTYLTLLGQRYAELSSIDPEASVSRFFGVFFMVYYASSVLGNVISSAVLRTPHLRSRLSAAALEESCAANFCYANNVSCSANRTLECDAQTDPYYFPQPSTDRLAILFGILTTCSVLSCSLIAMLTALKTLPPEEGHNDKTSLVALLRQMWKFEEVLLMPLALYSGIIYSFVTADFCLGYISCTVGIDAVGFVMSIFGAAAALGAIVFGQLLKYTGRQAIFAFGAVLNMSVLVALLKYVPTSDSSIVLHVFAGLWGLSTVIWTSQYLAFTGYVFRDGNKEAAFACNYTWQMVGTCAWHASSTFMCIRVQIVVMMVILSTGMIAYSILEIKLHRDTIEATEIQPINQTRTRLK